MLEVVEFYGLIILVYIIVVKLAVSKREKSQHKVKTILRWLVNVLIAIIQIIILYILFLSYPMEWGEPPRADEDAVCVMLMFSFLGLNVNAVATWINRKRRNLLFLIILENIYMVYKSISAWTAIL